MYACIREIRERAGYRGYEYGYRIYKGVWNGQLANAVQPSYLLGHSLLRESH